VSARASLFWAAAGLAILVELAAVALMLRPSVDPAYRAYYIDKTSDCWPHRTAGAYKLGTRLSFAVPPNGPEFTPNKICGWFYPDAGGTWSYGRFSRLAFVFPPAELPLRLTIEAAAMVDAAHPRQAVVVSANGQPVGTLVFDSATPIARSLIVPAPLAASGRIDLRLDYPDARPGTAMSPNADPHPRAIRVVALTLLPVS
jgi:hypothetical protein